MTQILFNAILVILTSLIQIVVLPINLLITNTMPDLSEKIIEISNNIETLFTSLTWSLGVVPSSVIATLLFILSVEIARHTIFISTHVITLVLSVIRRIKFW